MTLLQMGARPYDPAIGRFLNRDDPIPGGSDNNYGYAGADPVNDSDLTGTMFVKLNGDTGVDAPANSSNYGSAVVSAPEDTGAAAVAAAVIERVSRQLKQDVDRMGETARHFSDQALERMANAGVSWERVAHGATIAGSAMIIYGDLENHKSVGYALGDAGGTYGGAYYGGIAGTFLCGGEVDGVGAACGLGGVYVGGQAGSRFGGFIGNLVEKWLKGL